MGYFEVKVIPGSFMKSYSISSFAAFILFSIVRFFHVVVCTFGLLVSLMDSIPWCV